MGQLRASERDLERVISLSREHGYVGSLGMALFDRVGRAVLVGAPGTALTDAEELLRLAEQTGSALLRLQANLALVMAHCLSGTPPDVARFIDEQAESFQESARFSWSRAVEGLRIASRLLLAIDRPDEARPMAERATRACREMGARVSECDSEIILAQALRRTEGTAAAAAIRDALARARELVEETEARLYEPFILEEQARLAQLEGDPAAFDRKLREAHRLFTEIGATGHAQRLAKELGL
jgi:hypothetical protein